MIYYIEIAMEPLIRLKKGKIVHFFCLEIVMIIACYAYTFGIYGKLTRESETLISIVFLVKI